MSIFRLNNVLLSYCKCNTVFFLFVYVLLALFGQIVYCNLFIIYKHKGPAATQTEDKYIIQLLFEVVVCSEHARELVILFISSSTPMTTQVPRGLNRHACKISMDHIFVDYLSLHSFISPQSCTHRKSQLVPTC